MSGRFLYHAFWNFYDHMGTLILWGTGHALLALGLAVLAFPGLAGAAALPVGIILIMVELVLLVIVLSGLLPYCAVAASGEPARWRHIIAGIKQQWPIVTKILLCALLTALVLIVNIRFYLPLQSTVDNSVAKMALIFTVAILAWTCLFLFIFLQPWLSAGTFNREKTTVKQALRKALMAIALIPGVWLLLGIMSIAFLVGGLYTRIGLVLYIPLMTSFGQTAYQLAAQHADFLTTARDELGDGVRLRSLKRRALELGWEWEQRQPRRTFKELIRPWDY